MRSTKTKTEGVGTLVAMLLLAGSPNRASAQNPVAAPATPGVARQAATLQRLSDALTHTEDQVQGLEQQIADLKTEIALLKGQLAAETPPPGSPVPDAAAARTPGQNAQIDSLQEELQVQGTEIATQEQAKVESASRLPVRVSGLILLNGFTNSRAVDTPAAPSLVTSGSGATGLSLRQTVLGLDVRGPRVLGAATHADINVDFFGQALGGSYNNSGGLLRLRTAHGTLEWSHTRAFLELDRPLLNPYSPTSLTSVAVPPLAWAGNLWNWVPQLGVSYDVPLANTRTLRLEAALVDVPDAPLFSTNAAAAPLSASLAENSRYPAVEARIALVTPMERHGLSVGLGGYFSPHQTASGARFDAWAATADLRWNLPVRFVLSGNVYRGQALGGLGGGAYKDYVYRITANGADVRGLDDVGGWVQMKQRWSERLEFNAAFGLDNAFTGQLRTYTSPSESAAYQQLARNRTGFGNVIYSPSAYLSLSAEYRHLLSSPVNSPTVDGDVYGLGAGFKF